MGETKFIDKLSTLKLGRSLVIPLSILGLIIVGGTAIYTVNVSKGETTQPVTTVKPPKIKAVTALGRLEPEGEIIKLSPPPDLGGNRIAKLLVKQGDRVSIGTTIAILDSYDRTLAAVEVAKQDIKVAEANLAKVKAGAKQGDINAQKASVKSVQAELQGEIVANQAEIARLKAQLSSDTAAKQANIDRLAAELRNAESEWQRYRQLAKQGVISASEADSRRLAVDTAQKSLAEAQASYRNTLDTLKEEIQQAEAVATQNKDTLTAQIEEAGATLTGIAEVRDVDVVEAQANVDRAIAALRQAQEDLKLTYVKAPSNGQIIKINAYPGELVSQEEGLVEFGQTNRMMVVAEVYESDIVKVKLGQQANIRSETGAFSGEITGKVSQIGLKIGKQDILNTDPAADVDSRIVEVKIRLDEASSDRVAQLTNSKAIVKINL
jgi:HlyD family secretion protein